MRVLSRCLIALLAAGCLQAQPPAAGASPGSRLTGVQARRDARTLLRLLETTHPDPYLPLGGKVAFKRQTQDLLAGIPEEGLSSEALRDRLAGFLARLRDGHTFLAAPPPKGTPSMLPLAFGVAGDALFLAGTDLPELADDRGCRVVAVEGRPVASLLEGSPYQGENPYGDLHHLGRVVCNRALVSRVLPALATAPSITLTLETPGGRRRDRTIPWREAAPARSPDTWRWPPRHGTGLPDFPGPFATHLFERPRVAYLKVGELMGRDACEVALRNGMTQAQKMVADQYRALGRERPVDDQAALAGLPSLFETTRSLLEEMRRRRIPDLIVDLRGNGGGFTPIAYPILFLLYGDEAYGHAFQGRFVTVVSELLLKKRNTSLAALRAARGEPDLQLGDDLFPPEETPQTPEASRKAWLSSYRSRGYAWAPLLTALDGKPLWRLRRVVVLCDSGTFSAAFHTLFYFHELGAEVVGVPSAQAPNAFMEVTEFQLPESGLRGSISNSVQLFLPETPGARVFPPDHLVTYKQYRRHGFDLQTPLRVALDLLDRKSIPPAVATPPRAVR